jgi:integrase/recombinase XerD
MNDTGPKKNLPIIRAPEVQVPTLWSNFEDIAIRDAVYYFLQTLSPSTARAYESAFEMFYEKKFLNPFMYLNELALLNLENVLDNIRENSRGVESTKQARAAAFISFTAFLQRRTRGVIRKAIANKEKASPTFKAQKHKSTANALSTEECFRFLSSLKKLNFRDYLVAKATLQGAKRIGEVISARVEDIDWENSRITFLQLKSSEAERRTVITYPKSFMVELKGYLKDRNSGNIFISRNGGHLRQAHLWRSFVTAGVNAEIPFRVHPHSLRATAITHFVERGYSAEQISKVSGHASLKQVVYYDKTEMEKNLTTQISLI